MRGGGGIWSTRCAQNALPRLGLVGSNPTRRIRMRSAAERRVVIHLDAAVKRLPSHAVEISCYSKRRPLLFPQHGPGRKHERRIVLEPGRRRSSPASRGSSSAA